jgi:hypothetical protein
MAAAVVSNLPDDCDTEASAIRLASCIRVIEYRGVQYEAFPVDRRVAHHLLLPPRPAVEPACTDVTIVTGCGEETREEPDRNTTVRPIRGFDPASILWGKGAGVERRVLLIPFHSQDGWLLTPEARRFLNQHLERPLPEDYGVVAP